MILQKLLPWLNDVYACLDPYANLFLPMRRVIAKERHGSRVSKRYDIARTPFQRLLENGALLLQAQVTLEQQYQTLNPLALHKELEMLIAEGLSSTDSQDHSVASR
jgi:hypothetical protein